MRGRNHRRPRGTILLVVLGVLAAVSLVVTQFADYALQRAALAEVRSGKRAGGVSDQLSGALEAAVAVLASFREVEPDLRHPLQGWGEPARLLETWPEELRGVEVRVLDESARIGWSRVGPRQLRELLEGVGLRSGQVEEMVDVYLDAIDEDDDQRLQGRENRRGPAADEPWVPNRPLQSWAELWAIPEWQEAAWTAEGELAGWARALPEVFSLRHQGPANLNTMAAGSLEWLQEVGMISSLSWWERARPGPGEWVETIPGAAGAIASDWLGTSASLLRIRASRPLGQQVFWKEVWIRSRGGEDSPGAGEGESDRRGSGEGTGEPHSSWGGWEIIGFREGIEPEEDLPEEGRQAGASLVSPGFRD